MYYDGALMEIVKLQLSMGESCHHMLAQGALDHDGPVVGGTQQANFQAHIAGIIGANAGIPEQGAIVDPAVIGHMVVPMNRILQDKDRVEPVKDVLNFLRRVEVKAQPHDGVKGAHTLRPIVPRFVLGTRRLGTQHMRRIAVAVLNTETVENCIGWRHGVSMPPSRPQGLPGVGI